MTDRYNSIDLAKLICAYFVAIIHIAPFSSALIPYGDLLNVFITQFLCRLAVPFFFVSSGFFLYNKMSFYHLNSDRIKKYSFKMLRHYGTWTLLLCFGPKGQLWYLGASVIAVLVLYFLLSIHLRLKFIFIVSVFFYIIGVIRSSYGFILEPLNTIRFFRMAIKVFDYLPIEFTSGICCGLIFVFIGALFSDNKFNLSRKASLVFLIFSLLLLLA